MVYYGTVSKGCQRCRRRKIKCDQRKPGCLKCERSDTQCPGYRNLNGVLFRDESERVTRKARQTNDSSSLTIQATAVRVYPKSPHISVPTSKYGSLTLHSGAINISSPLSQHINELAANFFFAKYTFNEPPYSSDYHDWMTRSYFDDEPNHVLRPAIEAVGMAGISNVYHAPYVASMSRERYREALAAMKQALSDPVQAVLDTTFLAGILLGVYETVNFETWDRNRYWIAHVNGATALLELRGQEQFNQERGGQLYVQIRSQILSACVQQDLAVPPALVRMTYNFHTSAVRQQWQRRRLASPGSICEISFRLVNLRAAFRTGELTDPKVAREKALEIDADLQTWRAGVPLNWGYATIDTTEATPPMGTCFFNAKRQVYPNLWIAEVWNNWRALRILVNQIVVQNELRSIAPPDEALKSTALSTIHHFSADLCISAASFTGTPRILSLIRPMAIVAQEELNPRSARSFAVAQLRHIDATLGIRQAGVLAEVVSERLREEEAPKVAVAVPNHFMIPLIPSG